MPSFVCDKCQETLKKPKLDMHTQKCRGASFSCIDCYKSFKGVEYRQHFSCITESEKYEKKCIIPTPTPTPAVVNKKTSPPSSSTTSAPIVSGQTVKKPENDSSAASNDHLIVETVKKLGPLSLKKLKKALKKQDGFKKKDFKAKILNSIQVSLDSQGKLSFEYTKKSK